MSDQPHCSSASVSTLQLSGLLTLISLIVSVPGSAAQQHEIEEIAAENNDFRDIELVVQGEVGGDGPVHAGTVDVSVYRLHGDTALAKTSVRPGSDYRVRFVLNRAFVPVFYRIEATRKGSRPYSAHALADSATTHDITLVPDAAERGAIHITTVEELQRIGTDPKYPLSGRYVLRNDLDASGTSSWNDGRGFDPIGAYSKGMDREDVESFTGTFDGRGHTISGLRINRPDEDGVGLFASLGDATIRNLEITSAAVRGNSKVGLLAGRAAGLSEIENSHADGRVAGNTFVGGLVGSNFQARISSSSASGSLTETPRDAPQVSNATGGFFGGLVGVNRFGLIEHSRASVAIDVPREEGGFTHFVKHVGGLAGLNTVAEIRHSHAHGGIEVPGRFVGGLVGINDTRGVIFASSATGDVLAYSGVGGLVGSNFRSRFRIGPPQGSRLPWIRQSYATGTVSGFWRHGGVTGFNSGYIVNTYTTSPVTCSDKDAAGKAEADSTSYVGGLVGHNLTIVYRSFSAGPVRCAGVAVGGLVGAMGRPTGGGPETDSTADAHIYGAYWDVTTSGRSQAVVGGEGDVAATDSLPPGENDYARGLPTRQMQGELASEHMEWFDFEDVWRTNPDGYPELRWQAGGTEGTIGDTIGAEGSK